MNKGQRVIILLLAFSGLMMLVPVALPLYRYFSAPLAQKAEAKWTGSRKLVTPKDTVGVPSYAFTRFIGPMPQDCNVELMLYAHAPGGKPRFETLDVVAGTTCNDLVILNDPPRAQMILAGFGFLFMIGAAFMAFFSRKAS